MVNEKNDIRQILAALGETANTAKKRLKKIEVIPTGIDVLDKHVLGIGGFPRGKIVEISGEFSSGKSTFCQWLVGLIQKQGGLAWWADVERAMTSEYAQSSGIDLEKLVMPELGSGEDVLYKTKLALALNIFDIMVVDSIGATIAKEHEESIADESTMFTRLSSSKMWADFWNDLEGGYSVIDPLSEKKSKIKSNEPIKTFKKGKPFVDYYKHKMGQKKTCLIMINHRRIKPGISFGTTTRTSGGDRKDFAFALKLTISAQNKKKSNGELKYKIVTIKTGKNKVGVPYRSCRLLMYPDGRVEGLEVAEYTDSEPHGLKVGEND